MFKASTDALSALAQATSERTTVAFLTRPRCVTRRQLSRFVARMLAS